MSTTLFGKCMSSHTVEHEKFLSAVQKNAALIDRFGKVASDFDLQPTVVPRDKETVALNARAEYGRNIESLFAALAINGFHISEPIKTPKQFTDGWIMWTVVITGASFEFNLLYYTEVEAA